MIVNWKLAVNIINVVCDYMGWRSLWDLTIELDLTADTSASFLQLSFFSVFGLLQLLF